MTLDEIIKANADSMEYVSVAYNFALPYVTIMDHSEEQQEDIFLQGSDAEEFEREFKELSEQCPNVAFEDIIKHLAMPYVECIWG